MESTIKFIGKIHSPLKSLDDCPRQEDEGAPAATIEIFAEYLEGIQNIAPGTDLLLLTWLDKADRTVLKLRPRNDPNAPLTGVFSTRSPDRPNPIGIHTVKVVSVSADGTIEICGIEVLDQTPVVDIKHIWKYKVSE
ncbi:tRNA (N6-threonylcarbamoyladenosine(37)-N6)-methyltransferase TrmO [Mucilaginibacter sp.]|jgi:tRNA-Thr(GGU) m(6)t(6)A37 methyltransferase TsaA|uniref:tRNA (N6-threonylcarbamoyladenosine(37)-N6)-methyltransferase TrmO n=1 Tax=Mucilaginibacter sp. TaxID=1882438 RepID=UPI002CE0D8F1|nr:tRNA (N6-threonylcarbamoyladenosine(37)-N6)-methyltransferase TrmO [Mucilaginibacter sp.]HTI60055.1 tRNA (N6-threonylcarbamoyladenosine(37)-N6)-methyltransferase TrmO [Mucilaginibacter sp.]